MIRLSPREALAVLLFLPTLAVAQPSGPLCSLAVYPPHITLQGPRDEQRVGILGEYADGRSQDLSRTAKSTSEADILDVARDADGVLVTYAKLPGELLRQLQRCKVIGRFGLGVDNIDIKAAVALSCRFAGSKARFWVSSALAISRGVSCRRRRRSASR